MSGYYKYYLTYDSVRTELTIDPAGWDESGFQYLRSKTYKGMIRSRTLSLRFVRLDNFLFQGGGEIIKTAYDTEGLKAEITVEIELLNPNTKAYDNIYTGVMDLKPETLKFERDYVQTSIMDGSKENKFATRDSIPLDLNSTTSIDGVSITSFVSTKTILIPGITQILNAITDGIPDKTYSFLPGAAPESLNEYYLQDNIQTDDLSPGSLKTGEVSGVEGTAMIYKNISKVDKLVAPKITGTYDFIQNFVRYSGFLTADSTIVGVIRLRRSDDTVANFWQIGFNSPSTFSIVRSVTAGFGANYQDTGTFYSPVIGFQTLEPDWYYEFYLTINSGAVMINGQIDLNKAELDITQFVIEEKTVNEDETFNTYYPFEGFSRLIQLMTSETDTSKLLDSNICGRTDSEFVTYGLNGRASKYAILPGSILRGFSSDPYNITFKDIFKSIDAFENIGVAYDRTNERFYIEEASEFYKSGYLMFDLGEVSDFVISPDPDSYFNTLKAGYRRNVSYEEKNGLDEPCVPVEYSLDQPVKKSKDISSPYRGDTRGVFGAINNNRAAIGSEDTKIDNDIFLVHVNDSYSAIVSTRNRDVTGALTTTQEYYNKRILPRESAIRYANILNIPLWKDSGNSLRFIKSQFNFDFEYTNQDSNTVNELDDIAQTELLGTALFLPERYTLEANINASIIAFMNNDPHGIVKCTFDGVVYYGFIEEAKTKEYNRKATFILKATTFVETNTVLFEDSIEMEFDEGGAPITNLVKFED